MARATISVEIILNKQIYFPEFSLDQMAYCPVVFNFTSNNLLLVAINQKIVIVHLKYLSGLSSRTLTLIDTHFLFFYKASQAIPPLSGTRGRQSLQ